MLKILKYIILASIIYFCLAYSISYAGYVTNVFTSRQDMIPTIMEEDTDPTAYACQTLKFPNDSVTDNSDGSCSIDPTAGLASDSASFVTVSSEAGLSAERVLTAGEGIDVTDGGANTTVTVSGENASDTNKGIASFGAREFSVSSGVVTSTKSDYWNGTFHEGFDADVIERSGAVIMTLEQTGGGDLTTQFSSGNYTLDCTGLGTPSTFCETTLTVGTDSSPQTNWVYILQSAPTTLDSNTSSWPATEHTKVGFFLIQSAASLATAGGGYVNQNWNDNLHGSNNQGHVAHIGEKIRLLNATYFSGIDGNGTDNYLTPTAGNVEFKSTSGLVYQFHRHAFEALDTSASSTLHVKNWDGDAYHAITNLYDIIDDSTGTTIANNKYFNLVFWGVANKTGEHSTVMINLPSGIYNNAAAAISDSLGYDDFSIPREFNIDSSTGFLIARMTMQMKTSGGTWVIDSSVDLRGTTPQTARGGAASIVTTFPDNTFNVFDNTDSTKIGIFDIGTNVTTGNTRTLKWPDVDTNMWADNGSVPVTDNWDIGNYDITLKSLTGDGTIEGATITEGGNAVYNATETPGGELGNTWASPTIDDSVTVTGWVLGTSSATQLTVPTILAGGAGTLTIGGTGNTNNENLVFDFETDSNQVSIDSTTGASSIVPKIAIEFEDFTSLRFGNAVDAKVYYDNGTYDTLQFGLKLGSAAQAGYFSFMEFADMGNSNREGADAATDPGIRVWSADETAAADYVQLKHNQTDGTVTTGAGNLDLSGASGNVQVDGTFTIEGATNNCIITIDDDGTCDSGTALGVDNSIAVCAVCAAN